MAMNELDVFAKSWEQEAERTVKLLRALPPTQYETIVRRNGLTSVTKYAKN